MSHTRLQMDTLPWQRLSAALERGDCAAAREYLNDVVANHPTAREEVERGRFSRQAVTA